MKRIIYKYKKGDKISLDESIEYGREVDMSFINYGTNFLKSGNIEYLDDCGDNVICLRNCKITIEYDDKIDLDIEKDKLKEMEK